MPTDDERRAVARRLRSFVTDDSVYADVDACRVLHSIGLYYKDIDRIYFSGFDVARLADLIEPSDPTGRGVDSVYDWCRERLEGADGAEDELYCSIMRAIEDYRHPERATAHTVRAVDRYALLALADEMDAYSGHFSTGLQECTVQAWAVAIREALGVEHG